MTGRYDFPGGGELRFRDALFELRRVLPGLYNELTYDWAHVTCYVGSLDFATAQFHACSHYSGSGATFLVASNRECFIKTVLDGAVGAKLLSPNVAIIVEPASQHSYFIVTSRDLDEDVQTIWKLTRKQNLPSVKIHNLTTGKRV